MVQFIRRKFIAILLRLLARELSDIPKETIGKEEYDGLLSILWQNAAFRKYVVERDAKIIWTMAGGEGFAPEPRDTYALHAGQRVEILRLASEAKQAHVRVEMRRMKEKVALEIAREDALV